MTLTRIRPRAPFLVFLDGLPTTVQLQKIPLISGQSFKNHPIIKSFSPVWICSGGGQRKK
jgi:hypothetical protein